MTKTNQHRKGGTPDVLRPADLNRSGTSENQRAHEPTTTNLVRTTYWTRL